MWNNKKSILLSRICVIIFIVGVLAVAASAPWITNWFSDAFRAPVQTAKIAFMATIYTGLIPALFLLFNLYKLLSRIKAGEVFVDKNVACLRLISWCCFIGAIISLGSSFYYMPWLLVGASAVFVGLIVRVVKNVFEQAVALQDDADHTI